MQTHLELGLLQNWCISGSPEKNHNCRPQKQDIDVSLSSAVHFPYTRASQFKSTSQYPGYHANTNSKNYIQHFTTLHTLQNLTYRTEPNPNDQNLPELQSEMDSIQIAILILSEKKFSISRDKIPPTFKHAS
jgi:hypothetical protein